MILADGMVKLAKRSGGEKCNFYSTAEIWGYLWGYRSGFNILKLVIDNAFVPGVRIPLGAFLLLGQPDPHQQRSRLFRFP